MIPSGLHSSADTALPAQHSTLPFLLCNERNCPVFIEKGLLSRLHNLAHVEMNAIDLALDTLARFSGLPMPEVRPDPVPRAPATNGPFMYIMIMFGVFPPAYIGRGKQNAPNRSHPMEIALMNHMQLL